MSKAQEIIDDLQDIHKKLLDVQKHLKEHKGLEYAKQDLVKVIERVDYEARAKRFWLDEGRRPYYGG